MNVKVDTSKNVKTIKFEAYSASTYIHLTHHHAENFSKSEPKEIGFVFTPFPTSQVYPLTTFLTADDIPRCPECSAFFNCFNHISGNDYQCSLCGHWSKNKVPAEYLSQNNFPELKYQVYESYAKEKFRVRLNQVYTPTSYFLISLSLFQTHEKEIFASIESTLTTCYQRRQFGLAILHGSITLIKFRPFIEFETFCETPDVRQCLYYVTPQYFKQKLPIIQSKIQELKYMDQPDFCKRAIEHGVNMSCQFGTSLYYILDERDYNNFILPDNSSLIKSSAFKMNKGFAQTSIIAFLRNYNSTPYINPLFDFVTLTGGVFKIFESQNEITIISDMTKIFDISCSHDSFIFVCPPANSELSDFAGFGMFKSATGISIPKIKEGDSFCFKYNCQNSKNIPLMQFVVYYSHETGSRKMRVFTIPVLFSPMIDSIAQNRYVDSFVASRFLIEGREQAKGIFEQLKKLYVNVSCNKAEYIINNMDYIQAALCALSTFNSEYYAIDNNPQASRIVEARQGPTNYYNNVL